MRLAQEWTEQAEVFIVMGSSLQVQPAASFPVVAKRNGALLAIINREPGPLDDTADFVHHGAIGEFCARFGEMIADGNRNPAKHALSKVEGTQRSQRRE